MIQKSMLLTKRELEVLDKKLRRKKLTQQDSNYLSKFVRPKLREMSLIDSSSLLSQLEYRQNVPAIEKKIKRLILANIKNVTSITIYGSAIYSNYKSYNDIDVIVTVKKKFWKNLGEKYKKIIELKKASGLNLDLEIYTEDEIYKSNSVSLIYQLADSKTIYGILKLQKKRQIHKLALRMKLDYSILEEDASSIELYRAIRNLWIIRLVMENIVDNTTLIKIIENEIGKNLADRLKNNKSSAVDRKIAYIYLCHLLKKTLEDIEKIRWEKKTL